MEPSSCLPLPLMTPSRGFRIQSNDETATSKNIGANMASRRQGSEVKILGAMLLKDRVKGTVKQMPVERKTTPTRTARLAPRTLPANSKMEYNHNCEIVNNYI